MARRSQFAAKCSALPSAANREQATVGDFRRYDIVDTGEHASGELLLGAIRRGHRRTDDLLCESPVGSGALRLRGYSRPFTQPPAYDLTLEAENVPLAAWFDCCGTPETATALADLSATDC